MDEEDTIWRLDTTSLSGFAVSSSSHPSAQYELHVQHTIETVNIELSQTFETHRFPCHLQLILSPQPKKSSISPEPPHSGIVLLLPLCNILNLVISDHASHGQSLRFKLAEPQRHQGTATRQILSDDGPGRIYGPNEDDPYHLLGLLKFREFIVRNAGGDGRWGEVVNGWAECLQRNAAKEFNHHFQIVREDARGWWRILGEGGDVGEVGITVKKEGFMEDVAAVEVCEDHEMDVDGEFGALRTPSIDISEGTEDGEILEPEKDEDFERPRTRDVPDQTEVRQQHSPSPSRYAAGGSPSPSERSVISLHNHGNDEFRSPSEDEFYHNVRRPSATESSEASPEQRRFSRSRSRSPCRTTVNPCNRGRSTLPNRENQFNRFATGANSIHCEPVVHNRCPPQRFAQKPRGTGFYNGEYHIRLVEKGPPSSLASRISEHPRTGRDFRSESFHKRQGQPSRSRFANQSPHSNAGKRYDSYRPESKTNSRDEKHPGYNGRYVERKRHLEIERRE